jgi:hypothetical protein
MSLYKRGPTYWYRFRWNGSKPYRGSCKTSKRSEANTVESLVLAQLLENKRPSGSQKVPTLAVFSSRFFQWMDSLPTDRPPKEGTRKYYHVGWKLLEKTTMAGRRVDHIESDHISALVVGSSPANTNNALRTLRRMLKRAQEWNLIQAVPKVQLVEEQGREIMLEPWMEARLLAVTEVARTPTSKHAPKSINYGWQPFRDVLLIMLVPLSERVRAALLSGKTDANEGWVFPSANSSSGHIETVQKQFDCAKKLAGLPEAIVLYCARHRFGTDAMDGTATS